MIYQCDYGHETAKEVRRLPIGDPEQHAGLFVCHAHFREEIGHLPVSKIPAWSSLPLQYADDQEARP